MELHPVPFHFASFLEGVADICRIKAEQKGIYFKYESDNNLPIGVEVDEKRLRQVLINLLGNAIKFTETGGVNFEVSLVDNPKIEINKISFFFMTEPIFCELLNIYISHFVIIIDRYCHV